jgi:hypothetical protein
MKPTNREKNIAESGKKKNRKEEKREGDKR